MEEMKSRPGAPGDRAQVAAEKLRALRERANQALDEHRGRLAQIESELSLRIRQLAEEFETASASIERQAVGGRDEEVSALREQLELGRAKHEKFVEQLALARRQLDAIQAQPCAACQDAAHQLADAQGELGRLREQLETAQRQQHEDRARHDKFNEQIATARQAISDLQSKSHEQAAHLQTELESARAAKLAAEQHAATLARDLEAMHAECEAQKARADQLQSDGATSLDTQREAAEAALDAERQRVAALEAQLETARSEHAAVVHQNESLQTKLNEAEKQRDDLACEKEGWQREKADLDAALAAAKSAAFTEQQTLADRLAAAVKKQSDLEEQTKSAEAEKQTLSTALAESAAASRELQNALDAAQRQINALEETGSAMPALRGELEAAQAEAKTSARARDELQTALEAAQGELTKLRESTRPRAELDDLQHKFDLALADVQKLKRENGDLREQLASRPEATGQESPELVAVRAERDALLARIKDLENAAVAIASSSSSQETDDLHRRFEMAVDDVRQLKHENAQLRDQLAKSKSATGESPSHAGADNWAAQRARLMASLEQEEGDGPLDAARRKERASIEETIEATERIMAEKDREIAELRASQASSNVRDRAEAEDRRAEKILDADELVAAERKRLAKLQAELEGKLRSAELEFSVERAKLAREQAALKERLFELQKLEPQGGEGGDAKRRRGWRTALGLGENGEELTKPK